MKRFCFLAVPIILLGGFIIPTLGLAQEWTRFRGPNGSGISDTTFPPTWTEKDFAWSVELPGSGHSSPVIWGDKVFLTCAEEQTAQRTVVCLNVKDGSVAWKHDYGSHTFRQHQDNSYASATPTVDADHVYVCWNTPEEFSLLAFKHDGTEAWKIDLGAFVSQHGGGNSPIVVGDAVLIGDDNEGKASFLFGIDRMSGKLLWKTPRKTEKFSPATPVVFHSGTGAEQAVFCSKAEGMAGIDPKTGRVVWQVPGLFDSRTVSSPAVGDGLIFATCGEGAGGHMLAAIRPGTDGTAQIAWQTRSDTPYVPTPLVKGNLLFYWADRGIVTCTTPPPGKSFGRNMCRAAITVRRCVPGIPCSMSRKREKWWRLPPTSNLSCWGRPR